MDRVIFTDDIPGNQTLSCLIEDMSYYSCIIRPFAPSGKYVPPASTPSSTGGIGPGAWLSVGDSTLRVVLSEPGGEKLIGS